MPDTSTVSGTIEALKDRSVREELERKSLILFGIKSKARHILEKGYLQSLSKGRDRGNRFYKQRYYTLDDFHKHLDDAIEKKMEMENKFKEEKLKNESNES